jgi:taurine-pyruvate aminotransferase
MFRSETDGTAKFAQVSTFGGHPCSCAAGLANLDILMRERLWENSARVGSYLSERLRALNKPSIGEVRGCGLLIGLEMVSGEGREPMPEAQVVAVQKAVREAGVLIGRNNDTVPGLCNVLTLAPPLTLTTEGADMIVEAIEGAVSD